MGPFSQFREENLIDNVGQAQLARQGRVNPEWVNLMEGPASPNLVNHVHAVAQTNPTSDPDPSQFERNEQW